MSHNPRVTILGCGVSGLSCGIRLLENQFAVTMVARDLPPHTTSNAAAAIWYLYAAYPEARTQAWARITLDVLFQLMDDSTSGVVMSAIREMFKEPVADPWWSDVLTLTRLHPEELLPDFVDGYVMHTPLIETPLYMDYLLRRFQALGGQIEQRSINQLADIAAPNQITINCSGVWAKHVAQDAGVYPLRGQVIKVRNLNLTQGFIDETDPDALTYLIQRSDGCILGGTAQRDNWSLDIDTAVTEAILKRCTEIAPDVGMAEIISQHVGLRPGRHEVRLEIEWLGDRCPVIHNYGHGGAGFTLSWGCADEVMQLAKQAAVMLSGEQ